MSKKNAFLATAAAAAVVLGTVSPGIAAPANTPAENASAQNSINQGAKVLDVSGGEYVVMLELPAATKAPAGPASRAARTAVAEATQKQVDKAVREAFGDDVPAGLTTSVVFGHPSKVLVHESEDATMLVVGRRGHGGFRGLLLGSVSAACVAHAKCPVLVIHDLGQARPLAEALVAGGLRVLEVTMRTAAALPAPVFSLLHAAWRRTRARRAG